MEITPEMVVAGVEALRLWKMEADYISEMEAVTAVYAAMAMAMAILPQR